MNLAGWQLDHSAAADRALNTFSRIFPARGKKNRPKKSGC
jgi:hypothetical protein